MTFQTKAPGLNSSVISFEDSFFFEITGVRYTARQTAYFAGCDRRISVVTTEDDQSMESDSSNSFLTVLEYDQGEKLSAEWLETCLRQALATDDVLRKEFLTTILINGLPSTEDDLTTDLWSSLKVYGTKYLELHRGSQDIIPGPYARQAGSIWQLHRLYNDTQGAFLLPVKQLEGRRYLYFRSQIIIKVIYR
jgi:hypothetical protein